MFPGISCESLIREELYQGGPLEYSYSEFKEYLLKVLDFRAFDPERDRLRLDAHREAIWWAINEAWEAYITPDCHLPLQWISLLTVLIDKRALPRNVFHFGRCVMLKLDMARYLENQTLSAKDRRELERDYGYVCEKIDGLDPILLIPDIAEDRWGSSDQ